MGFRKLRIAWSVAWGVVAALLIVLWALWFTSRLYNVNPEFAFHIVWWLGVLLPVLLVRSCHRVGFCISIVGGWLLISWSHCLAREFLTGTDARHNDLYASVWWKTGLILQYIWAVTVLFVEDLIVSRWRNASSLVSGRTWSFSLRTLLIAITLGSIGLGLVVWMIR